VKIDTGQFHVYFSKPTTCIKCTVPTELKCHVFVRSEDISVDIETGLQSGKRRAIIRFLTGAGNSFLSKAIIAAVGVDPPFCLRGT
jgi:hypothetical protein